MNDLTQDFYIHYGTSTCANPHDRCMSPDEERAMDEHKQEWIDRYVSAIESTGVLPSHDFDDELADFGEQVVQIMCDKDDDKLGRVRDLKYEMIKRVAEFQYEQQH